jgi:hypothetical protein
MMWSEVGERTFFGPATIVEAKENIANQRESEDSLELAEELRRPEEEGRLV